MQLIKFVVYGLAYVSFSILSVSLSGVQALPATGENNPNIEAPALRARCKSSSTRETAAESFFLQSFRELLGQYGGRF